MYKLIAFIVCFLALVLTIPLHSPYYLYNDLVIWREVGRDGLQASRFLLSAEETFGLEYGSGNRGYWVTEVSSHRSANTEGLENCDYIDNEGRVIKIKIQYYGWFYRPRWETELKCVY